MSDPDDDAFETTIKIQRGNGTDDRDTLKTKVSADSIDELNEKVEEVRERLGEWAQEFRTIQPDKRRDTADDQQELGEVNA